MKKLFLLLIICFAGEAGLQAQQQFELSVSKIGDDKIKIEWKNPFGDSMVQLNVQRSWDSARNFRTVFVPLSPELPQNGYVDAAAAYAGFYYRIFYVLGDGSFFFTRAKKITTGLDFTDNISQDEKSNTNFMVTIHDDDTVIAQLNYNEYLKFKDSIINNTKDTLFSLTDADILIRYYDNNIRWVPSTHIYTNSDGYVQVLLADAAAQNYRLKILDDNHKPLFNIQHITEPQFILDKTDFMHSGWFYFELYDNDKIKERNKFYIPKDF